MSTNVKRSGRPCSRRRQRKISPSSCSSSFTPFPSWSWWCCTVLLSTVFGCGRYQETRRSTTSNEQTRPRKKSWRCYSPSWSSSPCAGCRSTFPSSYCFSGPRVSPVAPRHCCYFSAISWDTRTALSIRASTRFSTTTFARDSRTSCFVAGEDIGLLPRGQLRLCQRRTLSSLRRRCTTRNRRRPDPRPQTCTLSLVKWWRRTTEGTAWTLWAAGFSTVIVEECLSTTAICARLPPLTHVVLRARAFAKEYKKIE